MGPSDPCNRPLSLDLGGAMATNQESDYDMLRGASSEDCTVFHSFDGKTRNSVAGSVRFEGETIDRMMEMLRSILSGQRRLETRFENLRGSIRSSTSSFNPSTWTGGPSQEEQPAEQTNSVPSIRRKSSSEELVSPGVPGVSPGLLKVRPWNTNEPAAGLGDPGAARISSFIAGLDFFDETLGGSFLGADDTGLDSRRLHPLIFDPHSTIRVLFDMFSFVALLFDVITLPIILVWDIPVDGTLHTVMVCGVIFWYLDMIVNFRTGFFEHGDLITEPKRVALRYIKTWFFPDLFVLLSNTLTVLDDVEAADQDSSGFVLLRTTKTTRLLRIFGFVRMLRVSDLLARVLDRYWGRQFLPFVELPAMIMCLVILNHLIGCGWSLLGRLDVTDTGFRWMDEQLSWQTEETIAHQSVFFQWSTAVHWAITQMTPGSMSVQPANSVERIYNILCLLIGTIFFSSIVSRLSVKLTQLHETRRKTARSINRLSRHLRHAEVSTNTVIMATQYLSERLRLNEESALLDAKVVSALPEKMQISLHFEMYRKQMLHPLFHWWAAADCSTFKLACHRAVKTLPLIFGDMLFHVNEKASAVYVLVTGSLAYKQDPATCGWITETTVEEVESGKLISEAALWTIWSHLGTAEARFAGHTEVVSISLEQIRSCAECSEVVTFMFAAYGAAFVSHMLATQVMLPSDLNINSATHLEVLPALPPEYQQALGQLALRKLSRSKVKDLSDEFEEGKCMVSFTALGKVERVVVVNVVKLRRIDGRVLVHLVRRTKNRLIRGCQLPGEKLTIGEDPVESVTRIFRSWLAPYGLEAHVCPEKRTYETSHKRTLSEYGSTYQRIVHEALLTSSLMGVYENRVPVKLPELEMGGGVTIHFQDACILAKPAINMTDLDFMVVRSGTSMTVSATNSGAMPLYDIWDGSVCAWVTDEEAALLASDSGHRKLANYLQDKSDISHDLLRAATVLWDAANVALEERENRETDLEEGPDFCEYRQM